MGDFLTLPANYKLEISKEEIRKGILSIAPKVDTWVKDKKASTGKDPLFLCVLRGAVHFYSDLSRALNQSVCLEFIKYNTYDAETNSQLSEDKLPPLEIDVSMQDRAVMIVDDICESGRLLTILSKACMNKGASSVASSVLIYRDIPRSVFKPDFYSFKVEHEEWFVGYGLDDKEQYRNLPDIYRIEK